MSAAEPSRTIGKAPFGSARGRSPAGQDPEDVRSQASKRSSMELNEEAELRKRFISLGITLTNLKKIDFDALGEQDIDLENTGHLNAYVATFIDWLHTHPRADQELFNNFLDTFEGWPRARWAKVTPGIRNLLQTDLEYHGVYAKSEHRKGNANMEALALLDQPSPWPAERLAGRVFHTLSKLSRQPIANTARRNESPGNYVPAGPNSPGATVHTNGTTIFTPLTTASSATDTDTNEPATASTYFHQSPALEPSLCVQLAADPVPGDRSRSWSVDPAQYFVLPPAEVANAVLPPQTVVLFTEIWDRKYAYTGAVYDILDDKTRYFMDRCAAIGVLPSQFHAVFPSILEDRALEYYLHYVGRGHTFATMYGMLKQHFDTEVNRRQYHDDWTSLSYNKMKSENPSQNPQERLEALLDKLRLCQRALGPAYAHEEHLIRTITRACRGVPELGLALFIPAKSVEELSSQLQLALWNHGDLYPGGQFNPSATSRTDRKFNRGDRGDRYGDRNKGAGRAGNAQKKCYVCGKPSCWSFNHTPAEQKTSRERWNHQQRYNGNKTGNALFRAFLTDFEGALNSSESSSSESESEETRRP